MSDYPTWAETPEGRWPQIMEQAGMSEMVERVARAMVQAIITPGRNPELVLDEVMKTPAGEKARKQARAAIQAMREIPEQMKKFEAKDGNIVIWDAPCNYCGGAKFTWQAMIDEALK